jgi:glutaredoxin
VKKRKVTLYVRSVKRIVGTEIADVKTLISGGPGLRPGGFRAVPPGAMQTVEEVPKYELILPEDQKDSVETVRRLADRNGFDVHIIDVTKESILRREIQKGIEGIRIFPTLVTDSGIRIEGTATKERLESLLTGRLVKTRRRDE